MYCSSEKFLLCLLLSFSSLHYIWSYLPVTAVQTSLIPSVAVYSFKICIHLHHVRNRSLAWAWDGESAPEYTTGSIFGGSVV